MSLPIPHSLFHLLTHSLTHSLIHPFPLIGRLAAGLKGLSEGDWAELNKAEMRIIERALKAYGGGGGQGTGEPASQPCLGLPSST